MNCNLRNVKLTVVIQCHSNMCFLRHEKIVLNLKRAVPRAVLSLKTAVLNLERAVLSWKKTGVLSLKKTGVLSLKSAVLDYLTASDSEMLISRDQAVIQSCSPVHQVVVLEKFSRAAGLFLLLVKSLSSPFLQG